MARPAGFEPATPCLEGTCSIQLSYGRWRGYAGFLPAKGARYKGRRNAGALVL